jgi:hypothetical protein
MVAVLEVKELPNNTPEGICQPADGLPKPSVWALAGQDDAKDRYHGTSDL